MKQAKVIAVANQKGGTGKTTTAAALVYYALKKGYKVLAIDLDSQRNLTYQLKGSDAKGAFELLEASAKPETLIQATESGAHLIAASANLRATSTGKGSANRLKTNIKTIKNNYDFIIIDTPPAAGELQYNAIIAADLLLITMMADIFSLHGLYQLTDEAKLLNPSIKKATVITQYDNRPNIMRFMREQIRTQGEQRGCVLLGEISKGVVIELAQAKQQNYFDYPTSKKPIADYWELAKKVFKMI